MVSVSVKVRVMITNLLSFFLSFSFSLSLSLFLGLRKSNRCGDDILSSVRVAESTDLFRWSLGMGAL